jgi:predicted acyl esterase
MFSRRRFLTSAGMAAGAAVFDRASSGARWPAPKTPSRPWATDAGAIRVSPGPWTSLPPTEPGVHLENLYLRMPDGVRLNAFLYLPEKISAGQKIPGLLEAMPYRYGPQKDSYN